MAEKIWGPSYQEPTIFNKGMFWGNLVGAVVGASALAVVTAFASPPAAVGMLVLASVELAGGLVGGSMRKKTIELENANGKPVSSPTIFNEGFFARWEKVSLGMKIVRIALAAATLISPAPVFASNALNFFMVGAAVAGLTSGVAGAVSGKARMEKEYAAALEMEKIKSQGHGRAPSIELSQEPSKAQFVAAEMERRGQAGEKGIGA